MTIALQRKCSDKMLLRVFFSTFSSSLWCAYEWMSIHSCHVFFGWDIEKPQHITDTSTINESAKFVLFCFVFFHLLFSWKMRANEYWEQKRPKTHLPQHMMVNWMGGIDKLQRIEIQPSFLIPISRGCSYSISFFFRFVFAVAIVVEVGSSLLR